MVKVQLSTKNSFVLNISPIMIIGEMFKTNELFVDSCTLTAKFSFCVFIFSTEYAMTRHETKDNARLVDLFLFLKHHNNSGIFSFL